MEDNQPEPEPEPVVDLQIVSTGATVPHESKLLTWFQACLPENKANSEITIRVVDEAESQKLNASFRQINKSTNVLSFPAEIPSELDIPFLGDLVICAMVVKRESKAQNKPEEAHWAHMVVHGTLHLLGYDHENDVEAEQMESLETDILMKLGFPSPYDDLAEATPHEGIHHER